jgi:hypothetical protein
MRLLAVLAVPLLLVPASSEVGAVPKAGAGAKPPPPACGAKIFPLVAGTVWTYEQVASRDPVDPELERKRLIPRAARQVIVTVKSIEAKGGDTVAKLEEKSTYEIVAENKEKKKPAVMAEVVVNSTITCNATTKFEISPDSFFFAGEPGGYHELEIDKLERSKDTSLKLVKGTIGEDKWEEDIVAHFVRKLTGGAEMSGGKLELERVFTPAQPEDVYTRSGGKYTKAEKLQLITTGRITLDKSIVVGATPTPQELPKNWRTLIWLVPDIGVIQTVNMYAHQYQLVTPPPK